MNYFLKLNILNFNNEKIFKLAYSSIVNISYMLIYITFLNNY